MQRVLRQILIRHPKLAIALGVFLLAVFGAVGIAAALGYGTTEKDTSDYRQASGLIAGLPVILSADAPAATLSLAYVDDTETSRADLGNTVSWVTFTAPEGVELQLISSGLDHVSASTPFDMEMIVGAGSCDGNECHHACSVDPCDGLWTVEVSLGDPAAAAGPVEVEWKAGMHTTESAEPLYDNLINVYLSGAAGGTEFTALTSRSHTISEYNQRSSAALMVNVLEAADPSAMIETQWGTEAGDPAHAFVSGTVDGETVPGAFRSATPLPERCYVEACSFLVEANTQWQASMGDGIQLEIESHMILRGVNQELVDLDYV